MNKRYPFRASLCALALAGLTAAIARSAEPPPPAPNAAQQAADAALAAARQQEETTTTEENSREMARSATREIARSERSRAADALKSWHAADEALRQAAAGNLPAAQVDQLRAAAQARLTTLRAAAEQMIDDTLTANRAANDLFVSELDLRDKSAATRTAEIEALAPRIAAAEQSPGDEAAALRRQLLELEALRSMEIQQWTAIRKDTAEELAEQSGEAARIAAEIAAVEPDAAIKKRLEQFAARQRQECAAAEKIAADAVRQVEALQPEVYQRRVALIGGLKPLDTAHWNYAKARHLLVRAGFGGTPQQVEQLHQMGLHKAVNHLVEFYRQPQPDNAYDPTPLLPGDPLENKMKRRGRGNRSVDFDRAQVNGNQQIQIRRWWLQRLVESPRPLQEKLTLFWHGHFAAQDSVVQNSYAMFRQLQFFREHAAGNFGALLYGLVHDPAMIRYLDNDKNARGKPNENLAREIMELFSMGVDQGYTEQDIVEAARALTGYNYDHASGTFRFLLAQHDPTDKTIFGAKGPWTGDDLVRLILQRPETPRFIAAKLFEYFAYAEPDQATVNSLAAVLLDRQYALEPMLKNLFLSEEFYSPRAIGSQIKSPVELMVGLLRDLGAKPQLAHWPIDRPQPKGDGSTLAASVSVTDYASLDAALDQMGMKLLEPPDVKGWRYGRPWISSQSLFVRYNAVASAIESVAAQGVDVLALLEASGCSTSDEIVDYLARACLMRPLQAEKRRQLIEHLGSLPPCSQWNEQRGELNKKLRSVLVLMLCMPEHQLS